MAPSYRCLAFVAGVAVGVAFLSGDELPVGASPAGLPKTAGQSSDDRVTALPQGASLRLGTLRLRHAGRITSIAFCPSGKRFVSGSADKTVRLWDAATGQELGACKGHQEAVTCVAFSPDGRTVASGDSGGAVCLWQAAAGQRLRRLDGSADRVSTLAFSPDGQTLAVADGGKVIRLLQVATGQEARRFEGHYDSVISLAFAPRRQDRDLDRAG